MVKFYDKQPGLETPELVGSEVIDISALVLTKVDLTQEAIHK